MRLISQHTWEAFQSDARMLYELREHVREERRRYDEAMEWNRALVQQIVDLKKDGFRAPKPAVVPKESATAREIEEIARQGAREEFIQRAAAALMDEQQMTASDARATAEGLADAMYAQNVEGA